jgi:hypothetical protein
MAQITDAERTAMERNLRLLPWWWWIFRWVWIGEAFWVIYLIRVRGLTISDVIYFEAVLAGVALASEIPTSAASAVAASTAGAEKSRPVTVAPSHAHESVSSSKWHLQVQ